MCINITVAETVPDGVFARIEALSHALRETDANFRGVAIAVEWGKVRSGNVAVADAEDPIREALLRLLIEDALATSDHRPCTVLG